MPDTIEPALEAALDPKGVEAAKDVLHHRLGFYVLSKTVEDAIRAYLAVASPQAEIDRLREALTWIAALGGKTLISMEHGHPYSLGANAAFEQTADIARTALSAIEAAK